MPKPAKKDGQRKRKAPVMLEVEMGQGLIGQAAARVNGSWSRMSAVIRATASSTVLPETRSEVVIPLKIEDRVLGVMDVQSDRPHAFHPNDLLILEALADTIARAVERARLYHDLASPRRPVDPDRRS